MIHIDKNLIRNWADKQGAQEVWFAWRDMMMNQGREIGLARASWSTLPARDQILDAEIAFQTVLNFLVYITSHDLSDNHHDDRDLRVEV